MGLSGDWRTANVWCIIKSYMAKNSFALWSNTKYMETGETCLIFYFTLHSYDFLEFPLF